MRFLSPAVENPGSMVSMGGSRQVFSMGYLNGKAFWAAGSAGLEVQRESEAEKKILESLK